MKLFYLGILTYALVALTACGHKQEDKTTDEASRVVKVKVDTIRGTMKDATLHYSGTIEPLQSIPLSFEGLGTVENVFVQEGDIVKKGQVLATLDKADDESLHKATEAKYRQAKDAYDRLKSVYEKGSLPEIKWVEIETSLREAEAQMQLAQSSIKKCSMRAPVAGIIGKRNVEPGQNSLSLKTPIEIVKIETILVKISVAENEIGRIRKGQKATFSIAALNRKTFEGTVSNVGVVADEISRTYEVKIMAKNPDLEIKPGMVCDVRLNTEIKKNVLFVSNNAVSKDSEGKTYVFVVSPDKKNVKKQEVILGNYQNNGIEVTSGLNPKQVVVVEGKEKLSDNSLISL
jgi:RND family efflux transporter MFP subunit